MENILFKGEYLLKLDTVKEAFWTTNKKNIITYVFLLVLELLVWIWAFFNNELILGTAWVMLWLFILLLLYVTVNAPKNQIKAIKLKYHKDTVLSEVKFTDNAIVVHDKESGGIYQFYYSQLMKCFETKNLCVLVLWLPKTVLYVSKASIEGWEKDEFLKFIRWKIKS